jgi:hypothetical protein
MTRAEKRTRERRASAREVSVCRARLLLESARHLQLHGAPLRCHWCFCAQNYVDAVADAERLDGRPVQ